MDLLNDKFKIIYTGTIRPVNDVRKIINIAELLKSHLDIQFLIYGDGIERQELEDYCNQMELTNVIFKGNVEKKYIPYILSCSDITLLNYSQSMYNWSRGNSSNKLFEYFSAGKPVISTVKMGYSQIEKYKCGYEFEGDSNQKEVSEAIIRIKGDYEQNVSAYNLLCNHSIQASEEFRYSNLSIKLIKIIESVSCD